MSGRFCESWPVGPPPSRPCSRLPKFDPDNDDRGEFLHRDEGNTGRLTKKRSVMGRSFAGALSSMTRSRRTMLIVLTGNESGNLYAC
jgi:hypothetical protein